MKATLFHSLLSYLGWTLVLAACFGLSGGCSKAGDLRGDQPKASTQAAGIRQAARAKGVKRMTLQITSSALTQGHPIPKKYTGEGEDVSPPLAWSDVPFETEELALICDDPDAPSTEPWVHWVIYKIPANTKGLPEGVPRKSRLKEPHGALQGKNSWPAAEATGYRGPKPPPGSGVHHYYFKLYALDVAIDAEPGLTKKALLEKIHDHVLAEAALMGTYEIRP
jgi:Raf kinase inhibitor-like YbhB/YbcL family protein